MNEHPRRDLHMHGEPPPITDALLKALGSSPLEINEGTCARIKAAFPVPIEQHIFWMDAEFDLRPSGVACTNRGVFIKSNQPMFSFLKKDSEETSRALLFFYPWESFDPAWFTGESPSENRVLLVENQCTQRFISACRSLAGVSGRPAPAGTELRSGSSASPPSCAKPAFTTASAVLSGESAVFTEQKARANTHSGHGEMAEEAITLLDRFHGLDAAVTGRDNAKNGADRMIGGDIYVQTKYYNSAYDSLNACFDPDTGLYRYMRDGKPMQLEVPMDQYARVLEGFEQKIADGLVPGITDPAEAAQIVREGRLTYRQAVNLTKPGTIESLQYDALTGVVSCACAFGLSFVASLFLSWRKSGDLNKSIRTALLTGLQVFGVSFMQHMLVSQFARTELARYISSAGEFAAEGLGREHSAAIINGLRALAGKGPLQSASAANQLFRVLKNNLLSCSIAFVLFSVPETYRLITQKISSAQYAKNLGVIAASIAGGSGGALAAGLAAGKIAGAVGGTIAPGIGAAIGIAGGFAGGAISAKAADCIGDFVREDDAERFLRLFNAITSCMVYEHMMDESEMDRLVELLNDAPAKDFAFLMQNIHACNEQEAYIRNFLQPYLDAVLKERKPFSLPKNTDMLRVLASL